MSSDPHSPDTTDQQLAQRAQREWRHIFDAIGHPTIILDPDHCIIAANRAVQSAAGKSEQELVGKKCYEAFHSPDAAAPAEGCPMEKMLGSGRLDAVDMEMEAFGGWYMVSCTPVLDEAGRLEKIIHIATEITARKQIEESLRQGEARYRELFDHMSSGVAVYEAVDDGADFVFRDFNRAGERIDQTSRADVIGRRVTEAFPGVREFGLFEVFQRVWRTGMPEHFPVALYKDKRITGWRDNFVYRLPSGEVVAVYGDATKRKQAEERLEHLNAVLHAVRNVNQLITRETDRGRLLQGVCDNLVVSRGYVAAWAVLLDEAGGVGLSAASGLGESFEAMVERARGGALPSCVTIALEQPGVHVFAAPHEECQDCPMKAVWSESSVVCMPLAHGSRAYGILAVCIPPDYASDAEEQGLFTDVANDIAYALRQIELGEERQRAEQALRDSEEKYRTLFETMAEGVVYQDAAGDIISVNPAAERILGLSAANLLGRTSEDEQWQAVRADGSPFPGDEHAAMVALRTGEPVRNVIMGVFNPVDQSRRWILINAVPEFEPGRSTPARVYTTFVDITDLRKATAALRESEARLKSIFRAAPIGIGVVSDRVLLAVNDCLCDMLAYSRDELVGRNARMVYPTDEDYEFVGREKYRQIAERGTGTVETRFRCKDGRIIDVILSSTPLDPDNLAAGVTFTALDITERKRAEEALRKSMERYQRLETNIPGMVYLYTQRPDGTHTFPYVDEGSRDLFDIEPEDLMRDGTLLSGLIHPDDEQRRDESIRHSAATLAPWREELRHIVNGEVRWYDCMSRPTPQPDGSVFWDGVMMEITDRKRAEAALARQAEELARSNAELQQFAYVASHDLQEPLRKVTSYLQLLEERYKGRLDAGADEFIGFAVDGAQRMKRLISDLLEYSRVGTRGTPFEATDTGALLDRVLRDLQVTLSESLAHVTHGPLPTVMADSVQLSQVFQNMITNAVKFRREEPPRIHISAEQRGQEWVFAVRDNGMGIDPKLAERIFAMFQRLHGRGKYPGTGIGLAICKKIIERHGGRIWVESEPGHGSTFYFSLLAIEGERS